MKEEYKCQYCNSTLSTKGNLLFHQKNNKKCLEIQKNNSVEINCKLKNCEFCEKSFSSNIIKKHLLTCIIKKEKEYEIKICKLEQIIIEKEKEFEIKISNKEKLQLEKEKEFQNKIFDLEQINSEKDIKICELQTENNMYRNIYEKDHQLHLKKLLNC